MTRMSGINIGGVQIRKGSAESIDNLVKSMGLSTPDDVKAAVDRIAREGGTPLVVVEGVKVLELSG